MSEEVERVRRGLLIKLTQLEMQLVPLLSYMNEPNSSMILKNCLQQAEYYVMQIPAEEEEETAKEWREKLASWYLLFASKGYSDPEMVEEVTMTQPNIVLTGGEHVPPGTTEQEDNEFETKQPSKDELRSFLKKMFNEATAVETKEDIIGLKNLLALVSKAEAYSFPFLRDIPLQNTILEFIFAKMPAEMRLKFKYGDKAVSAKELPTKEAKGFKETNSVLTMKEFLLKEVNTLQAELKAEQRIDALYDQSASTAEESTENLKCSYCKEDGHLVGHCRQMKKLFCFNCNKRGHTVKGCPML